MPEPTEEPTEEAGEPAEEPTGKPKKGFVEDLKKAINKFKGRLDRNALLAAFLNATFWGFGYFYIGKRRLFGLMLMAVEIVSLVWLYLNPTVVLLETLLDPLVMVSAVLFFFALAYDAYKDAKEEFAEI